MTGWAVADQLALDAALRGFDHARVDELVQSFVTHVRTTRDGPPARDALVLVKRLQRKRYVGHVHRVVEALLASDCDTVALRHRYALALLDAGQPAAAEALLLQLPDHVRDGDPEVAGAVGRLHKQRYVDAGDGRTADLAAAVEHYGRTYRADPTRAYHGVNTASLLLRADRDGRQLPGHPEPVAEAGVIARALLDRLAGLGEPDPWDLATAAEAALVLGDVATAVGWIVSYVGSDADAFELASTLRQLQSVWQLDDRAEPGRQILPLLRARLLQAAGGVLHVSDGQAGDAATERLSAAEVQLERVFGYDRFQSLGWLKDALVACRSVARVEDRYGNGVGTGFVLDSAALGRADWPAQVVLTNAHVLPDALPVEDAWLSFRGSDDRSPVPAGRVLWQSDRRALDTCVLAPPDGALTGVGPLRIRPRFPVLGEHHVVRAYVVGHPRAAPEVQLSLQDTLVVHADDVHVHYRSPTEQGSSGSPVFDDQWRVMALHHGWVDAVPTGPDGRPGPANEGIRMDRLVAALREPPSGREAAANG